jgi:hypothetical protein
MSVEARSNTVNLPIEPQEQVPVEQPHQTKTPREHMDDLSRDGKYWEILSSPKLDGISLFDRQTRVSRIIAERLRELNEELHRIKGGMGFAQHVRNKSVSDIDRGRYLAVAAEIQRLRADYLKIFPPREHEDD